MKKTPTLTGKKSCKEYLLVLIFFISLFFTLSSHSQTISSTGSSASTCGNCTPTGWLDDGGTPDISNRTNAGGQGSLGENDTWEASPLPLPPTGDLTWISMRDIGDFNASPVESVKTSMGGIIDGNVYKLTMYIMTAKSNGVGGDYYSGAYIDQFSYEINEPGVTPATQIVAVDSKAYDKWDKREVIFIGKPDGTGKMELAFSPLDNAVTSGNDVNFESIHIAIKLNDLALLDTDGDGIVDSIDVDDDNDGILDTIELTLSGTEYDPLGDEDGDKLPNYLDTFDNNISTDFSETSYVTTGSGGIPDVYDFDDDGIPNHLDLDADNDGIPDNIEAQTTNGYIAPSGAVGAGFTDADNDGLDDNYDPVVSGGTPGTAITPVNSEANGEADYRDLDSDNDGASDTTEANIILSGTVGENGLDNAYDNGDDYKDVNGLFDNTQTDNFPDQGNNADNGLPDDVNWRDVSVTGFLDTDGDGIANNIDKDDDNDGIRDFVESCIDFNATLVSNTGVTNSGNLTGVPDDAPGELNTNGNIFVLDFGAIFPVGTQYQITWKRQDGATGTAIPIINESTDDATYTRNFNAPSSAQSDNFQTDIVTSNVAFRYIQITKQTDPSITDFEIDAIGVLNTTSCNNDVDGDGIANYLDLDSDNDGIPDNIEAQPTASYTAPTTFTDFDNDGLDDNYDGNIPGGTSNSYFTLVNTDSGSDAIPDYLDTDSDNDGTPDRVEANLTLSGTVGFNGLDNSLDNGDTYADVNGSADDTPFSEYPDNPSGGEIDWRDATSTFKDTDGDGVQDSVDLDDDNDGILDSVEGCSEETSTSTNLSFTTQGGSGFSYSSNNITFTNGTAGNVNSTHSQNFSSIDPNTNFEMSFTLSGTFASDTDRFVRMGINEAGTNTTNSFEDIDYAFLIRESAGPLLIYENGTLKGSFSNGADGNVLSIRKIGTTVTYLVNGAVIYTSIVSANGADYYVDNSFFGQTSTYSLNNFQVAHINLTDDIDGDGILNCLDLDSDNDGIPDNIEAQSTTGYTAPDGVFDANGVDTAYTGGITPEDTDGDGKKDYLETDSDNDGILDNVEAGLTLTGVYGNNGLDNAYDNGDNYVDVNGSFDSSQTNNFPDEDGDVFNGGDVDYRDDTFTKDTDGDGVNDEVDLDDDNDGIVDSIEYGASDRCIDVANQGTLDWYDEYNEDLTSDPTLGEDPIVTDDEIVNADVTIKLSRTSNVLSDSNYRINNDVTANSSYTLSQLSTENAESRHTFTFSAPVYNLAFTIYDVNRDNGTIAIDNVQLAITKEDGTNYTLAPADYTLGADNTNTGGNNFRGTGTGSTNIVINSLPIFVTKIQVIYTNAGSGNVSGIQDIAIGDLTFCTPLDSDNDGVFDYVDLDADNDGIPDNIEAQSTIGYIAPTGSYSITGIDLAYDAGITPVNTDGDVNADYLDLDSDGDGTNDIDEGIINEALPANSGGMFTGAVGTNGLLDALEDSDTDQGYTDINGIHVAPKSDGFLDDASDSDVLIGGDLDYRDTIIGVDSDNDGFANSADIDDDGDGIPDINESGGNDPDGDEDNDGTLNYLDTSDDGSGGPGGTTNYTDADGNGIPDVYDFDGDGVPNHLDIDADNDGIPDNVEAQTTTGYIAPATAGDTDTDNDGLNDAYDPDCSPCGGITGINLSTPNNHDSTDNPDYLDTDSDNDGIFDIAENQVSNGTDVPSDANTGNSTDGTPDGILDPANFVDTDGDGLADIYEGSEVNDRFDVNDEINTPASNLPDEDSDVNTTGDVDFRDDTTGVITPGVAGNILWLRADIGVTGTTTVTGWEDQSGDDEDAIAVSGTAPSKEANGINFNPSIVFDGTNDFMRIPNGILETDTYESLWVYTVNSVGVVKQSYLFSESIAGSNGRFSAHMPWSDATIYYDFANCCGSDGRISVNWGSSVNTFNIWTLSSNINTTTPTGARKNISRDGRSLVTSNGNNTSHSRTGLNNDFYLGTGNATGLYHNGELAEIMVFNTVPSDLEQQHIQSYLAIKYGKTLDIIDNDAGIVEGDYILKDLNTKIWDHTANSTYHNDVAGIGRDDAMVLNQKQSKSVNSDAIITIGLNEIQTTNALNTNTFTSNKDFLVWGNNNGVINTITETELICAPEKTIGRKWKIVENGSVGTVEITVTQATIDAALTTPNTVKVLKVADDAAFTTNVNYVPLTDIGTVYTADYDFNGIKYFTYSEINGIFWNGNMGVSGSWVGGNSVPVTGGPSTNSFDRDKVMVIDAQSTANHAILNENVEVECVWIKTNSKLMVADDRYLEFDEDFILDGQLRLIGDGQLVQTHVGLSNVEGNGKLFRDQQSVVPNVYRYHYWTSPVRELGLDTYRVAQVMKDGSTPTSASSTITDINWVSLDQSGVPNRGLNGATGSPITISNFWIYTNQNDPAQEDERSENYVRKLETGVIKRGLGYTMKSTGANPQNFTFVGTPNDGSISIPLVANTSTLVGNPYPSALDATDFINTNIDAIEGTLYFWEHTGEDTEPSGITGHTFAGYYGGYSQRNLTMGIAANGVPSSDPSVYNWETAVDNGSNVTQTTDDTEVTVEFSSNSITIDPNVANIGGTTAKVITKSESGTDTYDVTFTFDKAIEITSIYLFNNAPSSPVSDPTVTLTPDNSQTVETQLLTGASGQEIILNWVDVTTFTITTNRPYNLVIDDIKFKKGFFPSLGEGTYHAPNRYIAVAQGFFVRADADGGTLRFENSQRNYEDDDFASGGTFFFKSNQKQKNNGDENEDEFDLLPILKLGFNRTTTDQVQLHRQIGISFRRGNTYNYENGFDSEIFDVGENDIYWNFPEMNNRKLVIAGVSEITNQLEVPLTIATSNNESKSIQIDEVKNIDKPVYLLDKLTGTYYTLSKTPLELNIENGVYTNRFFITFSKENALSTEDVNPLNKELSIFMDNDSKEVVIQNNKLLKIKRVALFNVLGQKVREWKKVENITENRLKTNKLSATVYILNIETEEGKISKKILIE
ncbi:T9SS type A sorting domain-containing protein [Polaribacter haliotis]|uniref:T9SS type A sorting domain-containing protein n=1 Tax=Polaribacter haliotis TaxID=1888915 RepID=A0A7L8AFS4_9FLAO|nr:T9SS type A sorting domain-containing protein [Polaribacter haliotis]QOD60865.1 T9SS type A sorting domain-containing protein [Polaribacter haliotis]